MSSIFSPPPPPHALHSSAGVRIPVPGSNNKPDSGSEMWSRLRQQFTSERSQKPGRYYHNHERRRLSIKSILEATKPGSIRGKPFRPRSPPATPQPPPPIWTTTSASTQGNNLSAENTVTGVRKSAALSAQARYHRRLALSQALEAAERTKNSPGAYRSPPLLPPIED